MRRSDWLAWVPLVGLLSWGGWVTWTAESGADTIVVIQSPSGGGCTDLDENYDFNSGDLLDFTLRDSAGGTLIIESQQLHCDNSGGCTQGTYHMAELNQDACGTGQYVLFKVTDENSHNFGAVFRMGAWPSNYYYAYIDCDSSPDKAWLTVYDPNFSEVETINHGGESLASCDDNEWFGLSIYATGNDTEFRVWEFGASGPNTNIATWGDPNHLDTQNPDNPQDSGKVVGYMYKRVIGTDGFIDDLYFGECSTDCDGS